MIGAISAVQFLFEIRDRWYIIALGAMMLVGAVLATFGIGLIYPLW